MKNLWIWAVVAIIVVGGLYLVMKKPAADTMTQPAGTGTTTDDTAMPDDNPAMMESAIILSEQNDSGENGTVTLKEEGGKVMVSINMTGAPATTQPAHIHAGSCPTPGPAEYPLTNVVNGMSQTTLDVSLADLKGQMPLAVNVHKSAEESGVYVACGDISL